MVKEFIQAVFPPEIPPIARWRLVMAVLMAFMILHTAGSYGLLPGTTGFASVQSVQQIDDRVRELQATLLAKDIVDTRVAQCKALSAREEPRYWTDRLRALNDRYRQLTGYPYEVPNCVELGLG